MKDFVPLRPSGYDPEARFAQAAWDATYGEGARLNNTANGRVRRGTKGDSVRYRPGRRLFTKLLVYFQQMQSDYIVCSQSPGNAGVIYQVAKPPTLRFSIQTETIDGDVVTYAGYDTGGQTRVASDSSGNETQVITPRYLVDQEIRITRMLTAVKVNGVPLFWAEDNPDARAWLQV